ncbi:dTMP kinase [uncultured Synechococcus sp.]|uniref:dTMP kinase n=1 Tax=uncultured Synechococcus sp. TaxID=154535 RepID=UPI002593882C|nr:dTMP kinase [uncultured Synechococcus sp.]
MTARGKFLVLEGIDGCGKSTQLRHLATWLPSSGLMPPGAGLICSREPGGTALGLALRQLLLYPPEGLAPHSRTELLLYAADRAQHVQQCIEPALAAGNWVLCDRFSGSTAAYQGYGRLLDIDELKRFNNWAIAGNWPDLVVFIDVPLDTLLERLKKRELDRFEREDRAFFERIHAGFTAMAASDPQRWLVIDGTPPKDELASTIATAVKHRLGI